MRLCNMIQFINLYQIDEVVCNSNTYAHFRVIFERLILFVQKDHLFENTIRLSAMRSDL